MSLITQKNEGTGCKSPDQTSVGKLLLNAWSAELALRIKPNCSERDFLNASLSWTFPQAYYAVLFSARAVLAVDEIRIANPEVIEKLLSRWALAGKYGPVYTQQGNPFTDLIQHRITGSFKLQRMSGPEAATLHIRLTEKVHAVGLIHETYIINRMGAGAYRNIVDSLPDYLKNGFVGARATFLLSDD
ncbi:hypothetical protein [Spirosoma horti]